MLNAYHPPADHNPWQGDQTHHSGNRCLEAMRKQTGNLFWAETKRIWLIRPVLILTNTEVLRNFLFDKNTSIRGKTTSATASHSTTTAPTSGAFPGPVARSSTLEAFITAHGCSQIFKTLKMTTLNHLKLLLAFIPRLVYFWIIILKKKNIFFLTKILVRKTIT